MFSNTEGLYNTSVGISTLELNNTGHRNTAIGGVALSKNTSGYRNTAVGTDASRENITGYQNTATGFEALFSNTTGDNNTAVGYTAFSTGTNYSNSTAIGYDAEPGASNTIRLGNSVVGSIGGYAPWTDVSDMRFKKNVRENVIGVDFIKLLRPVTYQFDMNAIAAFNQTPDSIRLLDAERLKEAEIQTGFIAQEVEQAALSAGYDFHGVDKPKNETSAYGLRYSEFVVPLVKAVQEQQVMIEEQKTQITEQQKQIDLLLKRIEALERGK
jgi:hypothetical protein